MSLTAIICNPAFGFAGVGFPLIAMGEFPRLWGDALPLRGVVPCWSENGVPDAPAGSRLDGGPL